MLKEVRSATQFRDLVGSVSFGKVPVNSCDVLSDPGSVALDHSLQMLVGITNATSGEWTNPCESTGPKAKPSACQLSGW
jgi:hypothetical protein